MTTADQLKSFAKSIGVDLIGITPADFDAVGEKRLHDFIEKKRHGDMHYLEDYKKRVSPQQLLPNAKSIIVIGINYYREVPPTPPGHGRIARYAYGRDYHKVLKKILKQLAAHLQKIEPTAQVKLCVDSVPILEKAYAEKAGLGFIGKNTTLINPEIGSFFLLGEIITTAEFDYDASKAGSCGTCTRCIDACPTQAITSPGQLDATRCISYLTIEKRGEIPEEFHKPMGNLIFGCDICQEVCPYNIQFAKPLQLKEFQQVKIAGSSIDLNEILAINSDEEYLEKFAGSPLMRTKRTGLQRNARISLQKLT